MHDTKATFEYQLHPSLAVCSVISTDLSELVSLSRIAAIISTLKGWSKENNTINVTDLIVPSI